MTDVLKRLLEYDEYDPIGPLAKEAAVEIKRLREALKPFADYYEALERNGRLDGHMLVAQQGDAVLGHADIQTRDMKAAHDAIVAGQSLRTT
jgi:hypothetical protein